MKKERYDVLVENLEQITEALGCTNRLYYYQYYGKEAENDNNLMNFYIKQGGAQNFRRRKDEDGR